MDGQIDTPTQPAKNIEAYKALLQIEQQKDILEAKVTYWRAYILSASIPPIGLYYFIKYFFFGDGVSSSRKVAIVSLILTIISLLFNIWFIQLFFNQAAPDNNQNMNFMKELITPEDQKSLQQLIR